MAISTDQFQGVDLSRLPAPLVVEALDYAGVRTALLADLVALYPEFSALTAADPAVKLIELFAYRELLLRQRINEAALAGMVAFAQGADLDHLAARVDLERWIIEPGNPALGQPVVLEPDSELRARIIRAPEGWSVAGPVNAYVDLAATASSEVRYASCISPAPAQVTITIQSRTGDGTASAPLLAAVAAYLNDEDRRPVADRVTVQSATILPFAIHARLTSFAGPAAALVLAEARTRLDAWLNENERLGRDVTADALHAVLTAAGVSRVELIGWADIICSPIHAGHCTGILIEHAGVGQ